jgi:hypothetical protein
VNAASPDFRWLHDDEAASLRGGRLGSLRDMLRVYAEEYITLGQMMEEIGQIFDVAEGLPDTGPLREEELERVIFVIKKVDHQCRKIRLPISIALLERCQNNPPTTGSECDLLLRAIKSEISSRYFYYVEQERAKYYDLILPSVVSVSFPLTSKELISAANAFAAGLPTACVFHSMRAAEIGVRTLAKELGVSFPDKPIELAEWQNILDQADSKIVGMKSLSRGALKDEELKFYSQASVQFRYFKDAWRIRVAHARETYDDSQARRIFDHTLEFFETLSRRLKE